MELSLLWPKQNNEQIACVGADEADENNTHVHNDFSQTVENTEAQEVVGDDLHPVDSRNAEPSGPHDDFDVGVLVEESDEPLETVDAADETLGSELGHGVFFVEFLHLLLEVKPNLRGCTAR